MSKDPLEDNVQEQQDKLSLWRKTYRGLWQLLTINLYEVDVLSTESMCVIFHTFKKVKCRPLCRNLLAATQWSSAGSTLLAALHRTPDF